MAETLVIPGAVDIHTHLREPSINTSETIASGTRAALLGGFVTVADMPNNPGMPVWDRDRLDAKIAIAQATANIPIAFYAGSQPEADNVGELEAMARDAIGLKLYGDPTTGNENSYEARQFAEIISEWHRAAPNKPIMFHPGGDNLRDMIGLVARDIQHPLHICHVNGTEQVNAVNQAKQDGHPVTCGVCPHHLLKTSFDVHTHGAFAEMKPPLAHQDEAENLMRLLEQGYIDVIETDFAPHDVDSKLKAEHEGGHCYGVSGIEHVLPALLYQVQRGRLSLARLEEAVSQMPANILGIRLDGNTKTTWDVSEGAYIIGEDMIEAGCGWSPYVGNLAVGRLVQVRSHQGLIFSAEEGIRPQPQVARRTALI